MELTLDNLRNLYNLAQRREEKLPASRFELNKSRALTDKIWNLLIDKHEERES